MAPFTKLSRETKITVVGVLTLSLFLLEIVVGYLTDSIALIADSFHMLSDLLALCIAFYAIRLAKQRTKRANLSFGYQRAEILGAFANAVFLLALCFTIIIDAIQRFVTPVEIEDPKMVLIVGCAGLTANLLGLVLFGGHVGHDHGDGHGHSHSHSHSHGGHSHKGKGKESQTAAPLLTRRKVTLASKVENNQPDNTSEITPSIAAPSPILHYSAQTRMTIMAAADRIRRHTSASTPSSSSSASDMAETTHVVDVKDVTGGHQHDEHSHGHSHDGHHDSHGHHGHDMEQSHSTHNHPHSNQHEHDHGHGHGHSYGHGHGLEDGNMNMHGIFLHVLGDALGSVGVIISALIIMYGDGSWRFYMDPLISLLISGLIISSAIPLVRSASFVLLQGVPSTIAIDRLRKEIEDIAGVLDVHEFHVWGLSDSKNVASVHVRVHGPSSNPEQSYTEIAVNIKRLLHSYGIHSTTVQPEFVKMRRISTLGEGSDIILDDQEEEDGCLMKCEGGDCSEQVCCPEDEQPKPISGAPTSGAPVPAIPLATLGGGEFLVSRNNSDVSMPQESVSGGWFKKVAPFKLGKKDESVHINQDRGSSSSSEEHSSHGGLSHEHHDPHHNHHDEHIQRDNHSDNHDGHHQH